MNDDLEKGSQIPYIERAMSEGYEIAVLNTNLNKFPDVSRTDGVEVHSIPVIWWMLYDNQTQAVNNRLSRFIHSDFAEVFYSTSTPFADACPWKFWGPFSTNVKLKLNGWGQGLGAEAKTKDF